jgi:nucleotide-binding universal stress UspA family protein
MMSSVAIDISEMNQTADIASVPQPRRRLLCATDLAPRSDRAVRRAALLAKQMNADVLFVHVVSDRQSERVMRLKGNRARVRLTLQAEKAMAHAPEACSVEIHMGRPLKVIAQVAKEWDADMIILTAPVSRRYELVLGTTAERIIRSVDCPVLIVNREPESQYSQVAVATDLSMTSVRVAQAVSRMGLLGSAYAWFVHAFDPPHTGLLADEGAVTKQLEDYKSKWQRLVAAQLSPDLAAAGFDLAKVRISAEPARPLDAIEHIIEETRPELLVIGTSRWFMLKRMLMNSVAHQVLSKVRCDILAVPAVSAHREEVVEHPSSSSVTPLQHSARPDAGSTLHAG